MAEAGDATTARGTDPRGVMLLGLGTRGLGSSAGCREYVTAREMDGAELKSEEGMKD